MGGIYGTTHTPEELLVALCRLASGHQREESLTAINHFLEELAMQQEVAANELLLGEEDPANAVD